MVLSESAQTVIINFLLGLFFGAVPLFLLLRGFLPAFLNARLGAGKYLLRLHFPGGFETRWRVGRYENTAVFYKIGKEEFFITLEQGAVKRSMGVNWIDVKHPESAPFNYEKVTVINEEYKNDKGEVLAVVPRLARFFGYDDSSAVVTVLRTALMQPKKGLALGNIDFKKLAIVGLVIAAAIYVIMQVKAKNGGVI